MTSCSSSFAFTSMALRSLRLEEDLLERQRFRKRLVAPQANRYLLQKEARQQGKGQKTGSSTEPPPVCQDLVVQNAIFSGDLETIRELFPKGTSVNFIIESRGEDLRWISKEMVDDMSCLDIIVVSRAGRQALVFWHALVMGDTDTVCALLDDPQCPALMPGTIFDISDTEGWMSVRYNLRRLSMGQF